MRDWLREVFAGRPAWMNALMVFSAFMAFVYVPWDFLAKPMARDQEVWLGFVLSGGWAKLTEPLHWALYAAGAYGFYRMRSWMWPWAAVYAASVAVGMLLWGGLHVGGAWGWLAGVVSFVPFALIARGLWRAEASFGAPRPTLRDRYGEWALVTGASAGIGAEFARALARDGVSVVLSARRADRLEELAAELEKTYQVAARAVPADLADPEGATRLADTVADLPISILVANAGAGYAGRFDKQDAARLRDMVLLNCAAPVVLAARLLPGMRERGRGAVVVTGSVAGRQPLPYHAVYAATKAFDQLFGEGLYVELRGSGVDVLVLEPGPTETEFQAVAGESAHPGEPAAAVVEAALDALGRQPSVVSGWGNWLRANLAMRIPPRRLLGFLARDAMARFTPDAMR